MAEAAVSLAEEARRKPGNSRLQGGVHPLPRIATDKLTALYGKFTAARGVSLAFGSNQVPAVIGPSGCGKSTFLRTLNRMHELAGQGWITGRVLLDGEDIYAPRVKALQLRGRGGR